MNRTYFSKYLINDCGLSWVVNVVLLFAFVLGESLLPGWAITTMVGVGEMFIGAVIYLFMKKSILDVPLRPRYTPARTSA